MSWGLEAWLLAVDSVSFLSAAIGGEDDRKSGIRITKV
jgi:hypothetical protein